MYDDGLGLLEHIARPTMLTHGRADLVAAPEMISGYRALASDGRVQTFTGSGHFAFLE